VIQSTTLVAVHEHSRLTLIVNFPTPPAAGIDVASRASVAAQADVAAVGVEMFVDDVVVHAATTAHEARRKANPERRFIPRLSVRFCRQPACLCRSAIRRAIELDACRIRPQPRRQP
jgi:hypothetical protein